MHGSSGDLALPSAVARLMPTPCASDPGSTANFRLDGTPYSAGYGMTLLDAVRLMPILRGSDTGTPGRRASDRFRPPLLPTPTAVTYGNNQSPSPGAAVRPSLNAMTDWGPFAAAIARWEAVLGRPAPGPRDGKGRLAPEFVEWMMGLPAGWVTAVEGLSRNDMLRLLGNGVVPRQGAAGLDDLLHSVIAAAT
jgi:DNA (cytosine-5)-methyltransferase 1